MKPGAAQIGERRGLFCPGCGTSISPNYIAESYASPAGQYRLRVCRSCGGDVESHEVVVGFASEVIDVSGLRPDQLRFTRQMLAQFRRENIVIDMPLAKRPLALE